MDILDQVKQISSDLNEKFKAQEERAKDGQKLAQDAKDEMSKMAGQQRELLDVAQKQQKHLDELDMRSQRGTSIGPDAGKSMHQIFAERLEKAKGEADGDLMAVLKSKSGLMLDPEELRRASKGQKAVGDMSTSTNVTGTLFIQPQVLPGIQTPPAEPHIRNYMARGATNSNSVRYVQMTRGEGGVGMVAEAGLKPQMDYDLTLADAPVRKIAGHIRISDEMLDDIPFLSTLLAVQGLEDLMLKEDAQILYGTGTGEDLKGISVYTQAALALGTFRVATPNLYDILIALRLQVRKKKYRVSAAMISPVQWAVMQTLKDTQGRYLFPDLQVNPNQPVNIAGMTVVENLAVADGDIFVGNFASGAYLLDRKQSTIKYFDQDRDNAIKNLITIVIEERVALPVVQPDSFVWTNVTAAKAALIAA